MRFSHCIETDMALAKRDTARSYVRRRGLLRELVSRRLLCPALAREVGRQVRNYRMAWSALRQELRA